MRKLYCGGAFAFDVRNEDYLKEAKKDYRTSILKDVDLLLQYSNEVSLEKDLCYIGPFYFETENMRDIEIVSVESEMIERCTDAIFLLDTGNCPGTIAEMVLAATMKKRLHVFYVKKQDDQETESELRACCWYPILLCEQMGAINTLCACSDVNDASERIKNFVVMGMQA